MRPVRLFVLRTAEDPLRKGDFRAEAEWIRE